MSIEGHAPRLSLVPSTGTWTPTGGWGHVDAHGVDVWYGDGRLCKTSSGYLSSNPSFYRTGPRPRPSFLRPTPCPENPSETSSVHDPFVPPTDVHDVPDVHPMGVHVSPTPRGCPRLSDLDLTSIDPLLPSLYSDLHDPGSSDTPSG